MRSIRIMAGLVVGALGLVVTRCHENTTADTIQLGQAIFFDQSLSANSNQSCAACHEGSVGWTGPDEQINAHGSVYEGSIAGRFGNRKPPSSAYATFAPALTLDGNGQPVGGNFWDGRATGWKLGSPASDQAQGPFLNPAEQALPDAATLVSRVCNSASGPLFRDIWGASACTDVNQGYADIAYSIVVFESSSSVNAFSSKYDLYLTGQVTLSDVEQQGLALFQGKAKCANCHSTTPDPQTGRVLFTDFTFDNVGIPRNPDIAGEEADPGLGGFLQQLAADDSWRTQQFVTARFKNLSSDALKALAQQNLGKQRVPTLRNVDKRPTDGFVKAYGHNGFFKSLESIVHFYNTRDVLPRCPSAISPVKAIVAGCWPAPEVTDNLNTTEVGNLGLSPDEEAAVVAFLRTLSDGVL